MLEKFAEFLIYFMTFYLFNNISNPSSIESSTPKNDNYNKNTKPNHIKVEISNAKGKAQVLSFPYFRFKFNSRISALVHLLGVRLEVVLSQVI